MDAALLAKVEAEILPAARDLSLTVAGEPFMTPKLATFVALAERTNSALQLNTNATLITDSKLVRRVLKQASVIKFSVDGASAETYESIRVGADFQGVLENIRRVVRIRSELSPAEQPRLVMCMVLMRRNVHELVAMVDLAHGLGLEALEVAHLTVLHDDLDGESLRHAPAVADEALEQARCRSEVLGFPVVLPPRMDGSRVAPAFRSRLMGWLKAATQVNGNRLRRGFVAIRNRAQIARWERAAGGTVPCRFLRSGTFVTLGGDVNPCPMPGRPVAGNLLESSFAEIWNGEVLTAMRRGFLEGTPMACCAHCSQNPIGYDPSDEATARPPDPSLPGWFDGGISAGRATTNGGVGS
jgi:MoaA/NifB/PqqE/SkfB family radical SAM enzyme